MQCSYDKEMKNIFDLSKKKSAGSIGYFLGFKAKTTFCIASLALISLSLASMCKAEVLFDGFYKVALNGQHVGYMITQYEYLSSSKNFKMSNYLVLGNGAGPLQQSVTSTANEKFEPLSFQFTSLSKDAQNGALTKSLDVQFVKKAREFELKGESRENGKSKPFKGKAPLFTMLSNFLTYKLYSSPTGISTKTIYDYNAVAEEDGAPSKGTATVLKQISHKNQKVYQIKNDFKGDTWMNLVNTKGETLQFENQQSGLSAELVLDPKEAVQSLPYNLNVIKTVFGDIPKGIKNSLSKSPQLDQ